MNLTMPLLGFFWKLRMERRAKQIARRIFPELWRVARRKVGPSSGSEAELKAYAETRAAQLAQPLVDEFLRANDRIPTIQGNQMIILAASKAAVLVTKMAAQVAPRRVPTTR